MVRPSPLRVRRPWGDAGRLLAVMVTYVGGVLLVLSMFLHWPSLGRRGSDRGLRLIGRLVRLARVAGVSYGWLIGALWFVIPLCGALVMLLTAIATTAARRAAVAATVIALIEVVSLRHLYLRVRLDPWAGGGLVAALVGAVLACTGVVAGYALGRRARRQPSSAADWTTSA